MALVNASAVFMIKSMLNDGVLVAAVVVNDEIGLETRKGVAGD